MVLLFPVVEQGKKQIKEKLHIPKATQTHKSGSLPARAAAPCILVWIAAASLGLAAAALPSHWPRLLPRAQAVPGTRNHPAQGIPSGSSTSI